MAGLLILPAGLLAAAVCWFTFCALANWARTGLFRGGRRG